MRPIFDKSRYNRYDEASNDSFSSREVIESWESAGSSKYTQISQEELKRINSIPLIEILKKFNINYDIHLNKMTCPFPSHANGNEDTPSFILYQATNTYHCFGCKQGFTVIDFIMNYKCINSITEAVSFIDSIISDSYYEHNNQSLNSSQSIDLIIEFSSYVREKILSYKDYPMKIKKINDIVYSFDKMNQKYNLTYDSLNSLIIKIKQKLENI